MSEAVQEYTTRLVDDLHAWVGVSNDRDRQAAGMVCEGVGILRDLLEVAHGPEMLHHAACHESATDTMDAAYQNDIQTIGGSMPLTLATSVALKGALSSFSTRYCQMPLWWNETIAVRTAGCS